MANTAQADPLLDEKAHQQEQLAQSNINADTTLQNKQSALGDQLHDYAKFTPTPENKDGLLDLFALTAATTFLGGGGRQSGVNAMTNLTSAMQGYGQGRQDLFKRDLDQYHESIAQTQQHNQLIQDKIKQVQSLWTTDRDKAQQEMVKLGAMTDSGLIKNAARTGNLDKLSQMLADQQKVDMQMKMLQEKMGGGAGAALPPETIQAMAAQANAGDRTVFQNLGRGVQGAKNIVALRTEMIRQLIDGGKTPEQAGREAAAKTAEFEGLKSGERTLGTRSAQADMAVSEFQKVLPIAVQASEAVPRGSFVPANRALQAYESNTGDPKIKAFGAAINTLVNVYARAINPQGVGTVSDKEHAREILSTADSPEAFKSVVNILTQEALAAQASPQQVKQDMHAHFTGDQPQVERKQTRTGTDPATGRKVIQYDDGSVEYAP